MREEKTQNPVRVGMVVVVCFAATLTACSTAWVGVAEQIVAALIPAASNIVTLVAALQGKTVSVQDLQMIQSSGTQVGADLQSIQSLIAEYQQADATTRPGLLNQIQTAINTVQSNLNALLPALHIKDTATQAKISAVIGLVLSEVESLAAIVPLVNPAATAQMTATAARQAKARPPLTASEFVASYNATLTAKTGNAALDRATSGLRIHGHGKLTRWATAGVLK